MDALFSNHANLLTASILTTRDASALYTLKTTFGLRGRKVTLLRDENPPPGRPAGVGAIYWKEKTIEILGTRKTVKELRRIEGGIWKFNRTRHWRWAPDRREYELRHDDEGWKATINNNLSTAARLLVPARPHIFSTPPPPALHLTRTALEADEVFLILVLVYEETKRQDRT
ncbi:hypothetical protein H0H81_001912, partial [Sphagnurus paluster]